MMNLQGDKGQQVMDLIAQLEGKVREKNQQIDDLKRKCLFLVTFSKPATLLIGVSWGFTAGGLVFLILLWMGVVKV